MGGRYAIAVLILCVSFLFNPVYGQQDRSVIQHEPVLSYTLGTILEVEAFTSGPVEVVRFFYRSAGVEKFQVRNLDLIEENRHIFSFDTSQLPSLDFEYYLSAILDDTEVNFPSKAPEIVFKVTGESLEDFPDVPEEFPDVEEEARKFRVRFPVNVMGSVQTALLTGDQEDGEKKVSADGNIRVSGNLTRGKTDVNLDSNFNYTNSPYEGEKNVDLSNMMLTVARGNHTLSVGDININESEFSVYGLGRRGVEYSYHGNKASVHLFDVSSQQKTGFQGFGIPKSQISIYGGSVGYRFFNDSLNLKAVYLSGKDDPSLGANVGYDYFNSSRQGNVFAIVQEASLFKNSLTVQGEYARSDYDRDLEDQEGARSGDAWKIGTNFSQGILSIGGRYQYVGTDFNPIGYQYFTGDRQGFDANAGLNFGRINIMGSFMLSSDNVSRDPSEYTTKNTSGNLNLMWMMTEEVSLNLSYRHNGQNTSCEFEEQLFMQDSKSDEVSGTMAVNLSESANINLSLVSSFQTSQNNPDTDSSGLTVNLGGSFRVKEFLSLMPSLGYNQIHNKFNDETMRTVNTFLSAELNFIPQVLTTSLTGAYTQSESGFNGKSTTYNISGNLNLYLERWVRFGSMLLSIRGSYNRSEMSGYDNSFYSVMAQLDFSI